MSDGIPGEGAIIITGASSGVGAALALRLARAGREVLAVARRGDALAALAAQEPRIRPLALDLAAAEAAEAALAVAIADRPVAALVANAAVFDWRPYHEQPFAIAEGIVRVGLLGAMAAARAVVPGMIARRAGRIVLVGSVAGLRGIPGQAAYCAAKWGLLGFGEALGAELQPHGVTVATLCPGGIDTPLWDRTPYPGDRGRLLAVDEVCDAIGFLLTRPPGSTYKRMVLFPANEWH